MIKIETNFEESKKIKELGYDFSFASEKLFVTLEDATTEIVTKMSHRFYFCDGCVYTIVYDFGGSIPLDTIPIIPLILLEACLPDYERYGSKFTWGGRFSISLKYGTGEDLTIENYTTEHENVYEAFIWCAENYPDETRAKFKEVKKIYEVSK